MDRCPLCKQQAYFYGLQTEPLTARWVVCYSCRGLNRSNDAYTFRTEDGVVGTVAKVPEKAYFKTGKATMPDKREEVLEEE